MDLGEIFIGKLDIRNIGLAGIVVVALQLMRKIYARAKLKVVQDAILSYKNLCVRVFLFQSFLKHIKRLLVKKTKYDFFQTSFAFQIVDRF